MDKKQVMIVALLLVAVILSSASVMMNVSVLNKVEITQTAPQPDAGSIGITVLQNPSTTGGSTNG